jgi:hypothetical protein
MQVAFFHTHLGLGDLIYCVGAVRFLVTKFKEVRVTCWHENKDIFESLFHDLPNVIAILTNRHDFQFYNYGDYAKGCTFFLGGLYNPYKHSTMESCCSEISPYPYCFYDDMELPRTIMKEYFYIPRLPEYKELWEQLPEKYIFIHEQSTVRTVDIFSKLNTELLVLDPNKNNYSKEHPFYEKAQLTVGKRSILNHVYVMENAQELHLVDSSFLALAHQLDLTNVKKKVSYDIDRGLVDDFYSCATTFGIFQRVS